MPVLQWLPGYQRSLFRPDVLAGITLATFILPESMAYSTLAGLPSHFGIYSCLAGGLFFALFTTSRQSAVGPTSSISLMIGTTVAGLAAGVPERWVAIAALTALLVAVLSLAAYMLRLSSLVNFISNNILLGFKAGAALSIISTQLPHIFGLHSNGGNFFMRLSHFTTALSGTDPTVLLMGLTALVLLFLGDRILPGKPVSLIVVILAIVAMRIPALGRSGIELAGSIPGGLPVLGSPSLRLSDVDGVIELAAACFLMGYIETISAARALGLKNGYPVDARQELLSLGFANLSSAFAGGYVVAGGLSQSIVNDRAGARTPMSLLICSMGLALILIFFTGLLRELPMVVLAAIVIHAVIGLIKWSELDRLRRISPLEFYVALTAVVGVLAFGILKGVLVAVVLSLLLLLRKASIPHVAELGRIDESDHYSDIERHPENKLIPGLMILRPESPILYFNVQNIMDSIKARLAKHSEIRRVVLDMSVVNYIDDSGSLALVDLARELRRDGIELSLTDSLSEVRDMLRNQGMEEITGHISRQYATHDAVMEFRNQKKDHY